MLRTLALTAAAALLVAGCANQNPGPSGDPYFGSAVNRAKAAQVVDPDAPSRARPQLQLDGHAAKAAVDRYEKSFEAPPPPPAVMLNLSAGSAP